MVTSSLNPTLPADAVLDAFGDPIVPCRACDGYTEDLVGRVCECCRECGITAAVLDAEAAFFEA